MRVIIALLLVVLIGLGIWFSSPVESVSGRGVGYGYSAYGYGN